jgi:hypothetical protein
MSLYFYWRGRVHCSRWQAWVPTTYTYSFPKIEYHTKVHYYSKMCLWGNLWIDTEICLSFVHSNTIICIKRQYINSGVEKIYQKSRSHIKIVGITMMTYNKIHIEDPQILGAMIQLSVTRATWCPGLVHPCAEFLVMNTKLFDGSTYCTVYISYISLTSNIHMNTL